MTTWMVERELPGMDQAGLAKAQAAAISEAEAMRGRGVEVRYLKSIWAPERERCMCLFEAGSAEDVKALNDAAGLPYAGVTAAAELAP